MSTGVAPTFVNSTNSPLAPPYMYSVMRISALADADSIDNISTQRQAANRFEIDVMKAPVDADTATPLAVGIRILRFPARRSSASRTAVRSAGSLPGACDRRVTTSVKVSVAHA